MIEFFKRLFDSDFMSHGHCYFWRPEIVWLHAVSDGTIALSYYFIPVMLVYLVRKRRDLPFHWMFFMFGIFILGCGTAHVMELWTLWHGTYRLAGVIKAITAAASLVTAIALVPLVPRAMQLPSPEQLRLTNLELEKEIAARRQAEKELELERNFVAAVLNTAAPMILVIDLEGRIIKCNSSCEEPAGRNVNQLIGERIQQLFHRSEEADHFRRMLGELPGNQKPAKFESVWTTPSGVELLVSWSITILAGATEGAIHHIIATGVDITESKRLERAVLDISAREQRRIGQDLHDGIGQHLTGIAFKCKNLQGRLISVSKVEEAEMASIVHMVNECIKQTRDLARGLLPVQSEPFGLMMALQEWALEIEGRFGIACRLSNSDPVPIHNEDVATHLYRIAQEAVTNAVKHGNATQIDIVLEIDDKGTVMQVRDNGGGLKQGPQSRGLGLQIMSYRASMIGATLQISPHRPCGTVVDCKLPNA